MYIYARKRGIRGGAFCADPPRTWRDNNRRSRKDTCVFESFRVTTTSHRQRSPTEPIRSDPATPFSLLPFARVFTDDDSRRSYVELIGKSTIDRSPMPHGNDGTCALPLPRHRFDGIIGGRFSPSIAIIGRGFRGIYVSSANFVISHNSDSSIALETNRTSIEHLLLRLGLGRLANIFVPRRSKRGAMSSKITSFSKSFLFVAKARVIFLPGKRSVE